MFLNPAICKASFCVIDQQKKCDLFKQRQFKKYVLSVMCHNNKNCGLYGFKINIKKLNQIEIDQYDASQKIMICILA